MSQSGRPPQTRLRTRPVSSPGVHLVHCTKTYLDNCKDDLKLSLVPSLSLPSVGPRQGPPRRPFRVVLGTVLCGKSALLRWKLPPTPFPSTGPTGRRAHGRGDDPFQGSIPPLRSGRRGSRVTSGVRPHVYWTSLEGTPLRHFAGSLHDKYLQISKYLHTKRFVYLVVFHSVVLCSGWGPWGTMVPRRTSDLRPGRLLDRTSARGRKSRVTGFARLGDTCTEISRDPGRVGVRRWASKGMRVVPGRRCTFWDGRRLTSTPL